MIQSEHDSQDALSSPLLSTPNSASRARKEEVALFFLFGIGSTIGWTALLSSVVFYTATLGTSSYIYLNLAVYVPLFPITFAQAVLDLKYDKQYGSLNSFWYRGTFGFIFTVLTCLTIPFVSNKLLPLLITSVLLGTSSSILHGTAKQMASFIYPSCGRLFAATTAGMQASALLVYVISWKTGFGSSENSENIILFYELIAVSVGLCWLAFQLLISYSCDVTVSMVRRDSTIGSLSNLSLLDDQTERTENRESAQALFDDNADVEEISFSQLWKNSWPCCLSLSVTVGSSIAVSSWFNRVQSSDPSNLSLPRVLFYTRLFADFLSRPATSFVNIQKLSLKVVNFLACARLAFLPVFFIYTEKQWIPMSDISIIFGVAVFAFSSGFVATACYQLAPDFLPLNQKQNAPKQASLLNVCFSVSIILGLMITFILVKLGE